MKTANAYQQEVRRGTSCPDNQSYPRSSSHPLIVSPSHRLIISSSHLLIASLTLFLLVSCATRSIAIGRYPTPAQRDTALHRVAGFKHLGFQVIAARLKLGVETALAWRQLDTMLSSPTGDIFWMYPATGFYFNCKDKMSDDWRARFQQTWKRYTPYRGDTENHFLMYYSSLFLFSQEWPDLTGSEWFNGKSSQENYAESKDYLNHWIDETVRMGTTEWDSPRYLYYYLTPLIILRDFTLDPVMQRRFEMMLEYQLVDFAAEYLNGSYCGAHSRDGDGSVINPRQAEVTSYAQFYFEESLVFVLPDLAYAAMSNFQCPQIIRDIAHDRSQPFVHTELKRSRGKMRYSKEQYTDVHKYDYMTSEYCLGSIQGGLQQPIQQHTWDITFASNRPNNTVFALHPTWSATELGMFFPEEPELMLDGVTRAKASYTNPNKWIGGSPYEYIQQHKSTLVGTFQYIGKGDSAEHLDFFFPKTLDTLIRDMSGWIVCRMEQAFAAVRVVASGGHDWSEEPINWRLRSKGEQMTYIVECGTASEMNFDEFMRRLMAFKSPVPSDSSLNYTSPVSGVTIVSNRASARPGIADTTTVFNGSHLNSQRGSGIIEMNCRGQHRVLDFNRSEVRE